MDIVKKEADVSVELLDLKDWLLPIFSEAVPPSQVWDGKYNLPEVRAWADKIAEADGFIVVTPEYNHGYPAVLKNNFDHIFKEWNHKPVGFVAYGSAGGARAVEQLRQVVVELNMAPIRTSVHIFDPWFLVEKDDSLKSGALDGKTGKAESMLLELFWWARALKSARKAS